MVVMLCVTIPAAVGEQHSCYFSDSSAGGTIPPRSGTARLPFTIGQNGNLFEDLALSISSRMATRIFSPVSAERLLAIDSTAAAKA